METVPNDWCLALASCATPSFVFKGVHFALTSRFTKLMGCDVQTVAVLRCV